MVPNQSKQCFNVFCPYHSKLNHVEKLCVCEFLMFLLARFSRQRTAIHVISIHVFFCERLTIIIMNLWICRWRCARRPCVRFVLVIVYRCSFGSAGRFFSSLRNVGRSVIDLTSLIPAATIRRL